MAGYIRPNRQEVTRQFHVLGFTIRTPHRPAWFEVALATDPALFSRREGRARDTFYSSRAEGPLPAQAGEAVYLVPPSVLRRFAGKEKLYYALAVYRQPDFQHPEVVALPARAVPYVFISKSFTGQERRGSRGGLQETDPYAEEPAAMVWGGDESRPGAMTPAPPATSGAGAGEGSARNGDAPSGGAGNGRAAPATSGDGAAGALPAPEPGATAQSFTYDDGFDPALWQRPTARPLTSDIPLDPGPGGRSLHPDGLEVGDLILSTTQAWVSRGIRAATGALVSHAMIYVGRDDSDVGYVVEAVQDGVVRRPLGQAVAGAVLAVAYRVPGLTEEAARSAARFAEAQVGKPYNYDMWAVIRHRVLGGTPNLEPGTSSSFFCSQLVLEAFRQAGYGLTSTPPDANSPGDIAELALARRLQYVGHLVVDVATHELAYRHDRGGRGDGRRGARAFGSVTEKASRFGPQLVETVQRLQQEGVSEADIAAFLDRMASPPAAQQAAYAPAYTRPLGGGRTAVTLPGVDELEWWEHALLLSALPGPTTILFTAAMAIADQYDVTIGFGPAVSAGVIAGIGAGAGIVVAPGRTVGVYGSVSGAVGIVFSASVTLQVTIVRGGIDRFTGTAIALTAGAGEGIVGAASVLVTTENEFLGISAQIGAGVGLPIEFYMEIQRTWSTAQALGWVPARGNGRARSLSEEATSITFSPSQVTCADTPRDYPIFTAIGTTDPVPVVRTAVTKAVALLDRAIGELEHARTRVVDDGGEPAWPTVSDHTAASLRTRMLLDPGDRATWTGTGPRTVFFLVKWLKNIRKILAGGHITFQCHLGDRCESTTWAAVRTDNSYRIFLCPRWWRGGDGGESEDDKLRNRASSLIHEASHIYYSTVDDAGRGIWRADCLEQLVSDLSGEHLPAAFEESCGRADLSEAQSRAVGGESFDVNWTDVYLVPQLTGMSCWAAAAAMIVGWQNRQSINPADIARGAGFWSAYTGGLDLDNVDDLGRAWGLVVEPPQSYSVQGLRELIEHNGPIWMSMAVPSGHAVVVRGIYGDGTPGGTRVRVLDPWPPGQGSTYDLSIEQMAQRYQDLISVDAHGHVNTQVLHAGGRGGARTQGYHGSRAREHPGGDGRRAGQAAPSRAFGNGSFDVHWPDVQLVPQPTGMSCWAAAAAMLIGWRDRISIDPAAVASGSGFWSAYAGGLWPRDHDDLGRAWGLVVEPPQSYSVQGLRELIEHNGPLWLGIEVPSGSGAGGYGHAVVISGLYGDGTPDGTRLRVLDPWPPGQGARYEWTIREFARRYENRVTVEPDGSVNVQVLHTGGRAGEAQSQGYAARAQAARPAPPATGNGARADNGAGAARARSVPRRLDNQEIYWIVRTVTRGHSGEEAYRAVRTDRPDEGLAFGIALFTQASGLLGTVLEAMQRRDPIRFTECFGPQSARLLEVASADAPADRMQRVEGHALTDPLWVERFRKAGGIEAFHAAQNEVAIEHQFRPMLETATAIGLESDRALAMAYEAVLSMGLGEARAWLRANAARGSAEDAVLDRLVSAAHGPMRSRLDALRRLPELETAAPEAAVQPA